MNKSKRELLTLDDPVVTQAIHENPLIIIEDERHDHSTFVFYDITRLFHFPLKLTLWDDF